MNKKTASLLLTLLAVVPLLFECGWESDFDVVVCVASEPVAQVARLVAFRGFT